MKNKSIVKLIKTTDPARLERNIQLFDRILLYNLAVHMPKELIEGSIQIWTQAIKNSINIESTRRTEFMESTVPGRAAKINKEIDGEDLRLHSLMQLELATKIISANLLNNNNESDEQHADMD